MRGLVAIAAFAVLAGTAIGAGLSSEPPADERVRGVALGLFASHPEYDYGDLVDEVRGRGATDLLVVVQWTQPDAWSSNVARHPTKTATDETVVRTIRQARRAGMRVTVMPIVRLEERTARQWRGSIAPAPDDWFRSYEERLAELAKVADRAGAERLVIGSEFSSMQHHDEAWRQVAARARQNFSGPIGYSANWDAYDDVPFWDAVDFVGVTAYFPMTGHDSPKSAWRGPRSDLAALRQRVGKPVLVTEVGYPSHVRAADVPWDETASDEPAPRLQADLYRAFCDNFAEDPATDGYFVWNWFGFGGSTDTGFTPRGKPAAAELQRCFARR